MARQALNNGNFDVWQRGITSTPADVTISYTADRWADYVERSGGTLPTLARTRQLQTSGDIGGSFYFTRLTTNGAGTSLGVNSQHQYFQNIEYGVRNLCGNGKNVTLSFWARSSISNKRICPTLVQGYGTGGTPSADERIKGTPITLTASWVKYTATFITNTLVGKTFGTDINDRIALSFWLMWGTTVGDTNVQTGVTAETYVGSGNIDIAQVQLCAGSEALPFDPKSFGQELNDCQRYYQKSYRYDLPPGSITGYGAVYHDTGAATTSAIYATVTLPVTMRTAITYHSYDTNGTIDCVWKGAQGKATDYAGTVGYISDRSFLVGTGDATSSNRIEFHWTAQAEL
jgi:hypothetical protein